MKIRGREVHRRLEAEELQKKSFTPEDLLVSARRLAGRES